MANTTVNTEAAPIVVPPSGLFEGNDGPWSTFDIHVGTPPQPVRVLVSFIAEETWVISTNKTKGGCLATDPSTCAQARGGLFSTNSSTTWQDKGIWGLPIEWNLQGYTGIDETGDFGFDAMGLGLAGSGGIRFQSQTIAAIATKDYYLGHLGLNRNRVNFTEYRLGDVSPLTDYNNGEVSFLESMKASRNIPSMSGAYSAGAQYRNGTLATLTLGGYDKVRTSTNTLSVPMSKDLSRDLIVSVASISFSDHTSETRTLSSDPYLAFIDATVPEIWLPEEVCSNFEDAFGLIYNSTIERYLVSDTLHHILQRHNASVSFLLSDSPRGPATVNITLPYASFDLSLGPPFFDVKQNYFPLRRAANNTQYTLGRTFLQESYLIVDYERRNFSISQNNWYGDTTPQIVPIASTDLPSTVNNTSANDGKATSRHKMPAREIGTIIGAAFFGFLVAAVVVSFYFFRRRRRKGQKQPKDPMIEEVIDPFAKAEMDGSGKDPPGELDAPWRSPVEADSSSRVELLGNLGNARELAGSRVSVEIEGSVPAAENRLGPVEMDAGTHGPCEAASSSPHALRIDNSSSNKNHRGYRPSGKRKPLVKLPTSDIEER